MQTRILASTFFVVIAAGCASTPPLGNVIPKAGGNYEVVAMGSTKQEALSSALHTAETTCQARKMRHVVGSEVTKYKGIVSEDTNAALNKAQELISATTFKWIPTLSGDEDYEMTMGFSCEL